MRSVAHALDTGPASLYVYVANRDELHALLFDAALGTVEVEDTDPERWREQLHAHMTRMSTMMVDDFPGIAIIGMAAIPTGDNALRLIESLMSLPRAGGAADRPSPTPATSCPCTSRPSPTSRASTPSSAPTPTTSSARSSAS
jgi:hypothetical protein